MSAAAVSPAAPSDAAHVGGPAIRVSGLMKSYGDIEAVRNLDLDVAYGELLAVLGPNGAGKTTTVEILEGYRDRDAGDVWVLGQDPGQPTPEWRAEIGIVLQECKLVPQLTVRESVAMYAGYYPQPRAVDEVISLVGLGEQADQRAGKLSGGQQRRLDVGLALVGDPQLVFLDEPTTGFDPEARRDAWQMIAGLRDLGKTVVLTTHYMEEAQALADKVVVIVGGQIVARGTPEELGGRDQLPTRIEFELPAGCAPEQLPALGDVELVDGHVIATTTTPTKTLGELTAWANARGLELGGLQVTRPTLEDVYLRLIGADQ
ncbi:MAG: ABC transporter ATP-binding protein [Thermoleophilaceae bacterium]|nr:ABC transporter ATP-binding protein [Thermoleophilaceae bacterium]